MDTGDALMSGRRIESEEWRSMERGNTRYDSGSYQEALTRARAVIEQRRKADVRLRLVDHTGAPLAERACDISLIRHAFPFGCDMWDLDVFARREQADSTAAWYWKQFFAEVFNAANALCYWTERPRNDTIKTEEFQGDLRLESFDYCVSWARTAGLTVKGHPLFWSIPKAIPAWALASGPDAFMAYAQTRVRTLVARNRGRIGLWDAVNEALWEPAPAHLFKRAWPHLEEIAAIADYVEPVFAWARTEDPAAILTLNDYGLEQDSAGSAPITAGGGRAVTAAMQRTRLRALLEELRKRGCVPDALGFQSHTGGWMDHNEQYALYDEIAKTGIPIHITEFWAREKELVAGSDRLPPELAEALQAEYACNTLTCAFGHPGVQGFFFWGFMKDALEWAPGGDVRAKPYYSRIYELIHKVWTTREQVRTDADGGIRFRGFLGEYSLRFVDVSHSRTVHFTVRNPVDGVIELMIAPTP